MSIPPPQEPPRYSKWVFVADEDTEHWQLPEKYKPYVQSVYSVYFYDNTLRHFIDARLHGYSTEVIYNEEVLDQDDVTGYLRDEIYDWFSGEFPEDWHMLYRDLDNWDSQLQWFVPEDIDEDGLDLLPNWESVHDRYPSGSGSGPQFPLSEHEIQNPLYTPKEGVHHTYGLQANPTREERTQSPA